jgi:hypothetical protein
MKSHREQHREYKRTVEERLAKQYRDHVGQRPSAPKQKPRRPQLPLFSPDFQAKVERMDKLMKLAVESKTPTAPPGFTLIRRPGEPAGTLEQVGHEADQAWAGVKRIMQLLNVEKKHCFYNFTQTVSQSGVVQDLSGQISQGVGGAQRTGDSLKISRVRAKFRFLTNGGYNTMQAVIGRSKDGIPSAADLFQLVGSANSGLSFQNDDQDQANTWLSSTTVLVNLAPSPSPTVFREMEVKIDADTLYVAGTTTATSGALWVAFISDAAATLPSVDASFDMEFVDN